MKSDLLALSLPHWTLSRAPSHRSPGDMAWAPAQPLVGLLVPSTPLLSALGPCALPARSEHALTRGDSPSLSRMCETQATCFIPRPAGETEAERLRCLPCPQAGSPRLLIPQPGLSTRACPTPTPGPTGLCTAATARMLGSHLAREHQACATGPRGGLLVIT